ncbi:CRT-like, chloroquine-resistance transporter-like protein [Nitzschia inconspicua]|uniref:CRT-like, chloroquine-resistance transporter-like protein n=1 Tax=Nitzschia inconspicua TaxID=303405 RepID=A0A9K3KY49_9STRA|nr:CRT-like, chloroquine-resistance transporter-like protein [Nitzschia inconspicua]
MIPGGDHSSRTLLLRQFSSYSEVVPTGNNSTASNTPTRTPRPSSACYTSMFAEDDDDNNNTSIAASDDLSQPLLPSLEYEESSHSSSIDDASIQNSSSPPNWKLWVGFTLLVTTGVGNVIFAKLQALPMYNYPTFLNMYANLLYILMSFAYIKPVTTFGWFNHSIPYSHFTNLSKKPFFIMGCLDAVGAAMQVLATVYLPGTLLVLIPQAAIPLSMLAGSAILREKYTQNQFLGASVVFCGILVVLYPILTHQSEADHYCQAKDVQKDCVLCEAETTEEDCTSHLKGHNNSHHSTAWIHSLATISTGNGTDTNDNTDHYCIWISREVSVRDDDWLVFAWSIVMLISCVPSVMSTVYKQVALQTPLDPILVNGWVALFQFLCGMFLVVPSGLVSSPKVHPLELGTNWMNAMECLFTQTNSIHVGCHPDDCFRAALWVHISLANSAIYALAMIFVLKYGGCDLMYLGLTLVVPLGHLAFSFHSSFSTTSIYDILGLVVLVIGLFMYRFGYKRADDSVNVSSSDIRHHPNEQFYQALPGGEHVLNEDENNPLINSSGQMSVTTPNAMKEGFLEFLREPFMLAGDI